MGSRAKKILNLLSTDDDETTQFVIDYKKFGVEDGLSENREISVSNRTSSSLSSSSSVSSASQQSSFNEDTDDSVKDPDYKLRPDDEMFSSDEECSTRNVTYATLQPVNISIFEPVNNAVNISSSGPSFFEDTDDSLRAHNNLQSRPNVRIDSSDEEASISGNTTNNRGLIETETVAEPNEVQDTTETTETTAQNNLTDPDLNNETTVTNRQGRKRTRDEENWKKNIMKRLRNSGQQYKSIKTKNIVPERKVKKACDDKCKFKCSTEINETQRHQINKDYWQLGSIEKQWGFIASSVEEVIPKHRYVKINNDGNVCAPKREKNNAFHLTVSGTKIRVCKRFFSNTLGINSRPISTALQKKNSATGVSNMKDNRGCHGHQPKIDENIKNNIKEFIAKIPKIESHYTRANTSKVYIDGSKTVADLHRDYMEQCKNNDIPYGNYIYFYRIFTQEFNISFFTPKKDLCEVCEIYKNSTNEEKESKKEDYEQHQKEKELSRIEKEKDKDNKNVKVAVYDLQAVHQCPKGDISVFYYKSKLNVLNLSVYDLHTNAVDCYVWDESNAHRGVNEIATCVYKYLEGIGRNDEEIDVIFYSDNCTGQQKNKFMIAMYLFAVQKFANIRSITHKYLIKGHTQNEGDSAHSQIEKQVKRQLKSGPMYTPDAFIGAIKAARKKSEPFRVSELCFQDIYDWKNVCSQMGVLIQKDELNNVAKIADMKIIQVLKSEPRSIFFKTSYADEEYRKAIVIKKKKEIEISVTKAYNAKPGISDKKKADLMDLVNKNIIPRYYKTFFESL